MIIDATKPSDRSMNDQEKSSQFSKDDSSPGSSEKQKFAQPQADKAQVKKDDKAYTSSSSSTSRK